MSIIRKAAILLIAGILAVGVLGQNKDSGQQSSANILERRLCEDSRLCNESAVMDILSSDSHVSMVISDSLMLAELPGGYAALPNYSEKDNYKFKPASLRMEDILNSIVVAEPRYKWEVSDGVINIIPIEEYPLLNLRIAEFRVEDKTVNQMIDALKQHPAFKQGLAALNLEEPHPVDTDNGFVFGLGKPLESKKRFSVALKSATVRQILNEIVRQDDCAVWSYREWYPPSEKATGNNRYYDLGLILNCP